MKKGRHSSFQSSLCVKSESTKGKSATFDRKILILVSPVNVCKTTEMRKKQKIKSHHRKL